MQRRHKLRRVLHTRCLVGPRVSKQSQKRALTKPMLKVCMAKRENHFEPSVKGTVESPLNGQIWR